MYLFLYRKISHPIQHAYLSGSPYKLFYSFSHLLWMSLLLCFYRPIQFPFFRFFRNFLGVYRKFVTYFLTFIIRIIFNCNTTISRCNRRSCNCVFLTSVFVDFIPNLQVISCFYGCMLLRFFLGCIDLSYRSGIGI